MLAPAAARVLRALGARARAASALANPSLVREEREPVKDVVAVVVDRSASQTLGDRAAHDRRASRAELSAGSARCPTSSRASSRRGDARGRRRHAPVRGARATRLADVPPDRLAGVIMVTDGVVHDIPADRRGARLPRAAARAVTGRAERARPPHRARRGAALRHRRQGPDHPRRRCSSAAAPARPRVTVRRDGAA